MVGASDMSDYEKMRLENIRRNKELLQELHIPTLPVVPAVRKHPASTVKARPRPAKKRVEQPTRHSARLRGVPAAKIEITEYDTVVGDKQQLSSRSYERPERNRSDALALNLDDKDQHQRLADTLQAAAESDDDEGDPPLAGDMDFDPKMDANLQPLHDELAKLEIKHKWKTVQAVPDKVTNCLFHPSKSKLLGIVTDNSGSMAFWDVEAEDEDGDPVVYKYRPSLSSIGNAQFSKHDPSTLYLSSFDGTMKIWDMNKLTFTDIPMKNESPLSYFDLWDDANMVAFGTAFGELGFLDRRSGVETSYDIRGHNKKIGCVSVNPKHTHLVAAACNDRTVTIWDRRNIKVDEPLQELAHGYAVTSAYFSPTGKQLSTASYDDLLRVFDLNDAQELTLRGRIKHNCHVGKWVPLFRARWNQNVRFGLEHPHFVVGNMMRPINIFSSETMRKVHDLYDPDHITAVQAVNDFHPNLERLVVISGNGGGKVVCYT